MKHTPHPYILWTPAEAAAMGALGGLVLAVLYRSLTWTKVKESVFLTAKATAMVCWLFVGSWTFSSVFSYLGGEHIISEFVTGLEISPIMFLIMAQIIIFLLGWPLEWSEIIIIFVPIFLPMPGHWPILTEPVCMNTPIEERAFIRIGSH